MIIRLIGSIFCVTGMCVATVLVWMWILVAFLIWDHRAFVKMGRDWSPTEVWDSVVELAKCPWVGQ